MNSFMTLFVSAMFMLAPSQTVDGPKERAKELANQTVVVLRHSKPEELAKNLQKVFGASVVIQPTSGTPVIGLLLSGSAAGVEKAKQIIETLDKAPRLIPVEVILVELSGNAPIATENLAKWEADLQKLKTEGKLISLRKLDLPLVENQQSRIMTGENRPMATGSTVTRTGIASRSFTYNSLGTTVTAKARFEGDSQIVVDLVIDDARLVVETAKPMEKNEDVPPSTLGKLTFDNPVPLKKGQIVKVQGISDESKGTGRQIAVYLHAK